MRTTRQNGLPACVLPGGIRISRKARGLPPPLNRNPLDLVERDLIAGAFVKLRGARALVRGHDLRVFERTAGLKVGRDTGRAEHVAAELDLEVGLGRAPAE